MYTRVCLGILCSLLSLSAVARTIALDVTVKTYVAPLDQPYMEYDEAALTADGWVVEEWGQGEYDDSVFHLSVELDESEIPFARRLEHHGVYIIIDKNFVLQMGISAWDADAVATVSFELPRLNGQLSNLSPITLGCSGGDYASGMWSFHSTAHLEVF